MECKKAYNGVDNMFGVDNIGELLDQLQMYRAYVEIVEMFEVESKVECSIW